MKIRVSYSILNDVSKGNLERAELAYFGLLDFNTKATEFGKDWHKKVEEYINNNKKMPVEFGNKSLKNPKTELKLTASLTDWLDLSGVIDLVSDDKVVRDWKTGISPLSSYTDGSQLKIYQILTKTNNIPTRCGAIHHYNQYSNTAESFYLLFSKQTLREGVGFVIDNSIKLRKYLIENKSFERLASRNKRKALLLNPDYLRL